MKLRGRPSGTALGLLVLLVAGMIVAAGWWGPSGFDKDVDYVVPQGATLGSVARDLEKQHVIGSARSFLMWSRVLGSSDPIQAGEFLLPAHASRARILDILQHGHPIRRLVTIPEGMPSVMVFDRLNAERLLTGPVAVPPEGSVLPQTYGFERGDSRAALLKQMQTAMSKTLARLWANRQPGACPLNSPEEAVTLASIVEKETSKPAERPIVAGVYCNRLRIGMKLDADPTVIYPITRGKALGRRIRESELHAVTGYNTYVETGLPQGPITNPGKASLEAVLHPAATEYLYFVADGTGGHVFARTLDEQEANKAKWFAIRHARGEM